MLDNNKIHDFKETVWGHYNSQGRLLPWRQAVEDENFGYHVLVSELMLQQTQVNRVIEKYDNWLARFPTINAVAAADLEDVLTLWVGLGYNRRAKYLLESCKIISKKYSGVIPKQVDELVQLPGIGRNTASAIAVYAYNVPLSFIETNIRTVFIYHFFSDKDHVSDTELMPIISATVDIHNPREWYWALMDYGTFLKNKVGNFSKKSAHYKKQSKFEGSRRQLRAKIVRELIGKTMSRNELIELCSNDTRINEVLNELISEKIINKTGVKYNIFNH